MPLKNKSPGGGEPTGAVCRKAQAFRNEVVERLSSQGLRRALTHGQTRFAGAKRVLAGHERGGEDRHDQENLGRC